MVVHCSAGVGRTGTYIALDSLISGVAGGADPDVFACVAALRRDRNMMVQTEAQYLFVYGALLHAVNLLLEQEKLLEHQRRAQDPNSVYDRARMSDLPEESEYSNSEGMEESEYANTEGLRRKTRFAIDDNADEDFDDLCDTHHATSTTPLAVTSEEHEDFCPSLEDCHPVTASSVSSTASATVHVLVPARDGRGGDTSPGLLGCAMDDNDRCSVFSNSDPGFKLDESQESIRLTSTRRVRALLWHVECGTVSV